jgi:hypothetical protein
MKLSFPLLVILDLLLTACGGPLTSGPNSASAEKDGLAYYMETDKIIYSLDESVKILYRVTNGTKMTRELGVVPDCDYCICQFHITQGNEDIWRSCRVLPPCGFREFWLSPGGSWEWSVTWDMTNDNGTLEPDDDYPILQGAYSIVAEFHPSDGIITPPLSLSIEIQ